LQEDIFRQDDGLSNGSARLEQLMEYVQPGEAPMVTKLSGMTRSLINLLEMAKLLELKQLNLISLHENIDISIAAIVSCR
jgi:DNA invertase Pin-like site-specific DNA recombinase